MRLKLLLAYVGSHYSGWQIQEKPNQPPTIQGELEAAFHTLVGGPVRVHGAGRTDAGVHARGQVAHCDVLEARAGLDWRRSLNSLLPSEIRVLMAGPEAPDFHARNNVACKMYAYQFWQERSFIPPELAPFVWNCGPLNFNAIRRILPRLLGEHDFASLQNTGTDIKNTRRTIFAATITELPQMEDYPQHKPLLRLSVTADGFLKQMVRNIAGLLVACGRGKLDQHSVTELLNVRDRQALPSVTAPAGGLALVRVEYAQPTPAAHTIKQ